MCFCIFVFLYFCIFVFLHFCISVFLHFCIFVCWYFCILEQLGKIRRTNSVLSDQPQGRGGCLSSLSRPLFRPNDVNFGLKLPSIIYAPNPVLFRPKIAGAACAFRASASSSQLQPGKWDSKTDIVFLVFLSFVCFCWYFCALHSFICICIFPPPLLQERGFLD